MDLTHSWRHRRRIPDGANQDGLAEVKSGESENSSSYQRRLEVHGAVVNDTPLPNTNSNLPQ